jgi:hypothetical protein
MSRILGIFLGALALAIDSGAGRLSARQDPVLLPGANPLSGKPQKFDVRSEEGLARLVDATGALIQRSELEEKEWGEERRRRLGAKLLGEMTPGELREYFTEPEGWITRRDRRGLKDMERLARTALVLRESEERAVLAGAISELAAALRNNGRSPVPPTLDIFEFPWAAWNHWQNPIAQGRAPATNLAPHPVGADISRVDPAPSTFWRRPASIDGADLYTGFGRRTLPALEGELWSYEEPKTSYGSNPGFEVRSGDLRVKVKFAETTSEPFTARIFDALGYHVDPTDHVGHLKIRYDRRLLREFHLRKEIRMRCTLLGFIPVYTIKLQRRYDPFDYIAVAVMKDGTRLSGAQLKARLFFQPGRKHPEDLPGNFRAQTEREIDYLVTAAANVQIKQETVKSVGPWHFGELGHENLRELRGAGLLAAWLGWFDSRFENTRLKIVEQDGHSKLAHYFSDLGGGLGKGVGYFSPRGESPDEFGWTFTRSTKAPEGGLSFSIVGFKPIDQTPAFENMTLDDARWMARLIGQLTEKQIVDALVASGFDRAQVRLYREKLISRRDGMIRDLGLAGEIALLRPGGLD